MLTPDVSGFTKVDEIPFDFERRIMSVVVRTPEGKDRIISKGAPEAIFPQMLRASSWTASFCRWIISTSRISRRSTSG